MFGSSSEKTPINGQVSLFDSLEKLTEEILEAQEKITFKSHTKTPRQSGVRKEMLAVLPGEVEEYIISPEESCHKCGDNLKVIGKELVRTEVAFILAKLKVKQLIRQVAKCKSCGKKDSENKTPVFVNSYAPSRSTETAKSLVGTYKNYLITDAYAGYNKAGQYKRALCWAHYRRYFIDSIPLDAKGKEIKDLSYEEKIMKRQELSGGVLDAFWWWVEETANKSITNENLTKALTYARNQRTYIETFLEDGRIPLSNNLCESSIKPFATARRAWLFADSRKGARANAILYTLVETAKANELDIYEYLKYLLEEMPNNNHLQNPEILEQYMPWSKEIQDLCRLTRTYKKGFKK